MSAALAALNLGVTGAVDLDPSFNPRQVGKLRIAAAKADALAAAIAEAK